MLIFDINLLLPVMEGLCKFARCLQTLTCMYDGKNISSINKEMYVENIWFSQITLQIIFYWISELQTVVIFGPK